MKVKKCLVSIICFIFSFIISAHSATLPVVSEVNINSITIDRNKNQLEIYHYKDQPIRLRISIQNQGDDSPSGYATLSLSSPQWITQQDKDLVDFSYEHSSPGFQYGEFLGNESSLNPKFLMVEAQSTEKWTKLSETGSGIETKYFEFEIIPKDYGQFNLYYRVWMNHDASYAGGVRDPASNLNTDAVGFAAYKLTIDLKKPSPVNASLTFFTFSPYETNAYSNATLSSDINSPLIPTNDINKLLDARSTQSVEGLIADGVTPLLIKTRLPKGRYRIELCATGLNSNGIDENTMHQQHLYILDLSSQQYSQISKTSELDVLNDDDNVIFYFDAIKSQQLVLTPGKQEAEVTLTLYRTADNLLIASNSFKVCKPPIALIHGYNSNASTWYDDNSYSFIKQTGNSAFIDILTKNRRSDLVKSVQYGVDLYTCDLKTDQMGRIHCERKPWPAFYPNSEPFADNEQNISEPFQVNAALLDHSLKDFETVIRKNWAFTRYVIIGHSQGGVITRYLCQGQNPQLSEFESFRNKNNYHRGRFHRIITIGSPHNGSTIAYYIKALHILKAIPVCFLSEFQYLLQGYEVLQSKFNPWGPQISGNLDPDTPWFFDKSEERLFTGVNQLTIDRMAPYHLIRTMADYHNAPSILFSLLGLGRDIIPKNGQGKIDLLSELQEHDSGSFFEYLSVNLSSDLMQDINDTHLVILGFYSDELLSRLRIEIENLYRSNRILFNESFFPDYHPSDKMMQVLYLLGFKTFDEAVLDQKLLNKNELELINRFLWEDLSQGALKAEIDRWRVIPYHSDTIVDLLSQGDPTSMHTGYHNISTIDFDINIAHASTQLLGMDVFGADEGQTRSLFVADHIINLLDDFDQKLPTIGITEADSNLLIFGPFPQPKNRTEDEKYRILLAAKPYLKVIDFFLSKTNDSLRTQSYSTQTEKYQIEFNPPDNTPIISELSWHLYSISANGLSGEGLSFHQDGNNILIVQVDESVQGDVYLYATYRTIDNQNVETDSILVVSKPFTEYQNIQSNQMQFYLNVGETAHIPLEGLNNDGQWLSLFYRPGEIQITPSDPTIVEENDEGQLFALGVGQTSVEIKYKGLATWIDVFVSSDLPTDETVFRKTIIKNLPGVIDISESNEGLWIISGTPIEYTWERETYIDQGHGYYRSKLKGNSNSNALYHYSNNSLEKIDLEQFGLGRHLLTAVHSGFDHVLLGTDKGLYRLEQNPFSVKELYVHDTSLSKPQLSEWIERIEDDLVAHRGKEYTSIKPNAKTKNWIQYSGVSNWRIDVASPSVFVEENDFRFTLPIGMSQNYDENINILVATESDLLQTNNKTLPFYEYIQNKNIVSYYLDDSEEGRNLCLGFSSGALVVPANQVLNATSPWQDPLIFSTEDTPLHYGNINDVIIDEHSDDVLFCTNQGLLRFYKSTKTWNTMTDPNEGFVKKIIGEWGNYYCLLERNGQVEIQELYMTPNFILNKPNNDDFLISKDVQIEFNEFYKASNFDIFIDGKFVKRINNDQETITLDPGPHTIFVRANYYNAQPKYLQTKTINFYVLNDEENKMLKDYKVVINGEEFSYNDFGEQYVGWDDKFNSIYKNNSCLSIGDLNGDGVEELLAGFKRLPTLVFENISNSNQYHFDKPDVIRIDGESTLRNYNKEHPTMVDFNKDGLLDLILNIYDYLIDENTSVTNYHFYENIGSNDSPRFYFKHILQIKKNIIEDFVWSIDSRVSNIQSQVMNSSFTDIDNDGDLEIVFPAGNSSPYENSNVRYLIIAHLDISNHLFIDTDIEILPLLYSNQDNPSNIMSIDLPTQYILEDLDNDNLPDLMFVETNKSNLVFCKNISDEDSIKFSNPKMYDEEPFFDFFYEDNNGEEVLWTWQDGYTNIYDFYKRIIDLHYLENNKLLLSIDMGNSISRILYTINGWNGLYSLNSGMELKNLGYLFCCVNDKNIKHDFLNDSNGKYTFSSIDDSNRYNINQENDIIVVDQLIDYADMFFQDDIDVNKPIYTNFTNIDDDKYDDLIVYYPGSKSFHIINNDDSLLDSNKIIEFNNQIPSLTFGQNTKIDISFIKDINNFMVTKHDYNHYIDQYGIHHRYYDIYYGSGTAIVEDNIGYINNYWIVPGLELLYDYYIDQYDYNEFFYFDLPYIRNYNDFDGLKSFFTLTDYYFPSPDIKKSYDIYPYKIRFNGSNNRTAYKLSLEPYNKETLIGDKYYSSSGLLTDITSPNDPIYITSKSVYFHNNFKHILHYDINSDVYDQLGIGQLNMNFINSPRIDITCEPSREYIEGWGDHGGIIIGNVDTNTFNLFNAWRYGTESQNIQLPNDKDYQLVDVAGLANARFAVLAKDENNDSTLFIYERKYMSKIAVVSPELIEIYQFKENMFRIAGYKSGGYAILSPNEILIVKNNNTKIYNLEDFINSDFTSLDISIDQNDIISVLYQNENRKAEILVLREFDDNILYANKIKDKENLLSVYGITNFMVPDDLPLSERPNSYEDFPKGEISATPSGDYENFILWSEAGVSLESGWNWLDKGSAKILNFIYTELDGINGDRYLKWDDKNPNRFIGKGNLVLDFGELGKIPLFNGEYEINLDEGDIVLIQGDFLLSANYLGRLENPINNRIHLLGYGKYINYSPTGICINTKTLDAYAGVAKLHIPEFFVGDFRQNKIVMTIGDDFDGLLKTYGDLKFDDPDYPIQFKCKGFRLDDNKIHVDDVYASIGENNQLYEMRLNNLCIDHNTITFDSSKSSFGKVVSVQLNMGEITKGNNAHIRADSGYLKISDNTYSFSDFYAGKEKVQVGGSFSFTIAGINSTMDGLILNQPWKTSSSFETQHAYLSAAGSKKGSNFEIRLNNLRFGLDGSVNANGGQIKLANNITVEFSNPKFNNNTINIPDFNLKVQNPSINVSMKGGSIVSNQIYLGDPNPITIKGVSVDLGPSYLSTGGFLTNNATINASGILVSFYKLRIDKNGLSIDGGRFTKAGFDFDVSAQKNNNNWILGTTIKGVPGLGSYGPIKIEIGDRTFNILEANIPNFDFEVVKISGVSFKSSGDTFSITAKLQFSELPAISGSFTLLNGRLTNIKIGAHNLNIDLFPPYNRCLFARYIRRVSKS